MTTTRPVSFAEFRRFLKRLGYRAKKAEAAWVLHHPTEGLLVFRRYGDEEIVDEGDRLDPIVCRSQLGQVAIVAHGPGRAFVADRQYFHDSMLLRQCGVERYLIRLVGWGMGEEAR